MRLLMPPMRGCIGMTNKSVHLENKKYAGAYNDDDYCNRRSERNDDLERLAVMLTNLIEKYADKLDLGTLPPPPPRPTTDDVVGILRKIWILVCSNCGYLKRMERNDYEE